MCRVLCLCIDLRIHQPSAGLFIYRVAAIVSILDEFVHNASLCIFLILWLEISDCRTAKDTQNLLYWWSLLVWNWPESDTCLVSEANGEEAAFAMEACPIRPDASCPAYDREVRGWHRNSWFKNDRLRYVSTCVWQVGTIWQRQQPFSVNLKILWAKLIRFIWCAAGSGTFQCPGAIRLSAWLREFSVAMAWRSSVLIYIECDHDLSYDVGFEKDLSSDFEDWRP